MIISKGFDSLRVKQTPDVSLAKNPLDDSFSAKLLYSASYNDLDNNTTVVKKSSNGYLQHQRTSVPAEYQSVPQKTQQKGSNAPKVSQRLPSPFGSTFQKSPLPPKKNVFVKPLLTEGGLFDAIDNMVHMHEYKNAQELLSPLKKRRIPRETEESDQMIPKKINGRKGKNPLIPLKNYMLMTKMNEALYKSDDIFKQKLDKVYKTHQGNHSFLPKPIAQENLRLNEMITLGPIKPSSVTGVVKKMLHAPTLKLYTVKEVPINSRESRQNLKAWLEDWQSALQGSKYNIRVFNMFFNSPEGCLSIVTEFMGAGSLQNLLDSLINIPEKALKIIALQTLLGLSEVHDHLKTSFGALSPSQILFDKQGNIKLSLGLRGRITATGHSHQRGKSLSDKALFHGQSPNEFGSLLSKKNKPHDLSLVTDNKLREGISQDIFDFGFLMLTCALGGMELFDNDGFLAKLKIVLAEIDKKPQERSKYCCLIHNQELISSVILQNGDEDIFLNKPVKVQRNNTIMFDKSPKQQRTLSIKEFLACNNYSKNFIDFLCSCLKFDPNKRGSLISLFTSHFLQDSITKGPNTSIHDLIKISTQWNHNNPLRPEIQGPSEGQLKKLCDALAMVLPNCNHLSQDSKLNKLEALKKLTPKSQRIKNLSAELGLPPSKLWESISKVLDSVIFTDKLDRNEE